MSFDKRTAAVTVILRELGVSVSVSTKSDRIAMQKAIYLAQLKGPDLGFRFSWYLNGPYSVALADRYYQAYEERALYADYTASASLVNKLQSVKSLIDAKPEAATLCDWLEAVASLHFMIRVMGRSRDDARARCEIKKPHLRSLLDGALDTLVSTGHVDDN